MAFGYLKFLICTQLVFFSTSEAFSTALIVTPRPPLRGPTSILLSNTNATVTPTPTKIHQTRWMPERTIGNSTAAEEAKVDRLAALLRGLLRVLQKHVNPRSGKRERQPRLGTFTFGLNELPG
jgi:hypothetical protein